MYNYLKNIDNRRILLITIFSLFLLSFQNISAQKGNYQLSTHVLDITVGTPVENVKIILFRKELSDDWTLIDNKFTDKNGRITSFLENKRDSSNYGIYKLRFETNSYFNKQNKETFYPYIEVVFKIEDNKHYHVPITLTPFGYSTYRGN
ncbi:hydroxyisourate hydrolase [Aestuariibaculum sp. M13]|uniref:hydroxyisourate hydrolase n=1 Tax=Aestuariibaculum sp. M13 TaxID=2967132 RepID=UPI002159E94A|nr:hydroxyisourate hydrolase [Aestuariibaculum sp. M13]MCR8668745.1 hydroxyisourate hydrolase [Aestuariibaculum sp. M13]